jgi:hypothetical protein
MSRAYVFFFIVSLIGCAPASPQAPTTDPVGLVPKVESKATRNSVPVIHVFVALCDNVNQGIVPVSASLGNGDDPARNLYWGAAFGVKTFFSKSADWQPVTFMNTPGKSSSVVLDRIVLKHRKSGAFLVAEAYRGSYIRQAIEDFLAAAAGIPGEKMTVVLNGKAVDIYLGGSADMIVYVGHDGLMDFQLTSIPRKRDDENRDAVILACASKNYFADALRVTGAKPLLWTTNLMAPEAYILSAAIEGWLKREPDYQIRTRAAAAYDKYQHCGMRSANMLFATGW